MNTEPDCFAIPAGGNLVALRASASLGGERFQVTLPNGRGASIIRNKYSYGGEQGLWELAVLDADGRLDYTTPVTSDVLGHLSSEDVNTAIAAIAALEPGR